MVVVVELVGQHTTQRAGHERLDERPIGSPLPPHSKPCPACQRLHSCRWHNHTTTHLKGPSARHLGNMGTTPVGRYIDLVRAWQAERGRETAQLSVPSGEPGVVLQTPAQLPSQRRPGARFTSGWITQAKPQPRAPPPHLRLLGQR